MNQQQLIEKLQNEATRNEAFRLVIQQYKKPLYLFIRKIVIDHQDTDEVLQLTFIKVFKYINSFKGSSTLSTWMMKIARNEAVTFLQKKAKRQNSSLDEMARHSTMQLQAQTEFYSGTEIQLKLQNAVAQLPEKQREVFNMKYFDNLKYTQIAEITGTSTGGLKANYFLAVKRLKELLITV